MIECQYFRRNHKCVCSLQRLSFCLCYRLPSHSSHRVSFPPTRTGRFIIVRWQPFQTPSTPSHISTSTWSTRQPILCECGTTSARAPFRRSEFSLCRALSRHCWTCPSSESTATKIWSSNSLRTSLQVRYGFYSRLNTRLRQLHFGILCHSHPAFRLSYILLEKHTDCVFNNH